jgi:hypothetical protein
MDLKQLEEFWTLHGWLMVLSPASKEQQMWCQEQFGYSQHGRKGDHSVMLFREAEHRTRYLMVWGTGDDRTTFWHPV